MKPHFTSDFTISALKSDGFDMSPIIPHAKTIPVVDGVPKEQIITGVTGFIVDV